MKLARRTAIIVAATSIVAASLVFITYTFIASQTQGWNMQKAERHIALVQPAIRADARFQHVDLAAFTSDNGCLLIQGYVTTEQALSDLQRIIAQSRPPVLTKFAVYVIPDEPSQK